MVKCVTEVTQRLDVDVDVNIRVFNYTFFGRKIKLHVVYAFIIYKVIMYRELLLII